MTVHDQPSNVRTRAIELHSKYHGGRKQLEMQQHTCVRLETIHELLLVYLHGRRQADRQLNREGEGGLAGSRFCGDCRQRHSFRRKQGVLIAPCVEFRFHNGHTV